MTDRPDHRLSERGEERKHEMLLTLQDEMHRVHTRRARRGRAVAGTVLVAIVGVALWLSPTPAPTPVPKIAESARPGSPPVSPTPVVFVRTDVSAVARCLVATHESEVPTISDAELLSALHAAGHDCGIVRVEGDTRLSCDVAITIHERAPGSSG